MDIHHPGPDPVEPMERSIDGLWEVCDTPGEGEWVLMKESALQDATEAAENLISAYRCIGNENKALRETTGEDLLLENLKLKTWLMILNPHLDAVLCYASTTSEHPPNQTVKEVREYFE